ncbi:MAG: transglycosylase domain-containing protein, partial [Gammaproteobacteria bacterium]|nr:transglycosylase domain-containing protein [Gammaproteobacteria bacterium]
MQLLSRMMRYGLMAMVAMSTFGLLALMAAYLYLAPGFPSIEALKDVRLQVPLRIYSHDGALIAEYGKWKRTPMQYHEVPELLTQAVLAAEDDRFFEHPGVDYQGILRAVYHLLKTGERGQGGSTITMQVARNFFLSREKTYARKLNEIFLALEIEGELSKEEILELYLNKIFLGHRAYGFAAAAEVYYGKPLDMLDTAQLAMLAGLPKAPSRYNPIVNPERALTRRNYVLGRLHQLGAIDDISYELALAAPVTAERHGKVVELEAPYVAEMVRVEMIQQYGDAAYTSGLNVYTTLDTRLQRAANTALRRSMLGYDRRHGYRGAEAHLELPEDAGVEQWQQLLADAKKGPVGELQAGLVVALEEQAAYVYTRNDELLRIEWAGLNWARAHINENRTGPKRSRADEILKPGDVIRYDISDEGYWQLAQIPEVAGALVSLRPNDGAVQSLVGGFDFYQSNF